MRLWNTLPAAARKDLLNAYVEPRLPWAVRKGRFRLGGIMGVWSALVFAGWLLVGRAYGVHVLWIAFVPYPFIGAVFFVGLRRASRLRARVEQYNGALCLSCIYPLPETAESGSCPECGRTFVLSEVRGDWQEAWITPGLYHIPSE